jgi:hypothetical protein
VGGFIKVGGPRKGASGSEGELNAGKGSRKIVFEWV